MNGGELRAALIRLCQEAGYVCDETYAKVDELIATITADDAQEVPMTDEKPNPWEGANPFLELAKQIAAAPEEQAEEIWRRATGLTGDVEVDRETLAERVGRAAGYREAHTEVIAWLRKRALETGNPALAEAAARLEQRGPRTEFLREEEGEATT